MLAWRLTKQEWKTLRPILEAPRAARTRTRGRPRLSNTRAIAEACLFRYFHSRAPRYRAFGWNEKGLHVSPATANRRFREWHRDGRWMRALDELIRLRGRRRPRRVISPVRDALAELERAYSHLNGCLFAHTLPTRVLILLENAKRNVRGRFRPGNQACIIAISLHTVHEGAAEVLAVLLHEMVHLRNHCVGLPDVWCGYHNRHFRDSAIAAGLKCVAYNTRRGYACTRLAKRGRRAIAAFRARGRLFRELQTSLGTLVS